MKKRQDSFIGFHFDYHAQPQYGLQGATLKEEDIREICRTLKPDFIQIDCKGHPGWASYPSKIGNAMPEFAQDTLALWRRVTREENVALYMHYSGVYDIKYCNEHPEESVLWHDGTYGIGCTKPDGKYVDEILIPQLCELAGDYGVDGVWVDGECWRTAADFRPESLAAFERATGIDLKGNVPKEPSDPYYEEYREYYREIFRSYLRYYVDRLHEKYPDFQIASNWAFSDHMPEEVCANVDYLSGDLNPFCSFHSARYAARALAQQEGHAWDLMSWNFRIRVGNHAACVAKHPNQIMQEAAAVIAMGGAYQNYIKQYNDGSPNMNELRALLPVSDFLRERKDYCFRGTPIHQAALLLSTYDRARESLSLYSRNGYEKIMGATALLCDVGQSLEIICEHTLNKHRDEYKMIIVPELYQGLADETIHSLLEYAKLGGKLVLAGKNTCRLFAEADAPFDVRDMAEYFGVGEKAYDNGGDNGHDKNAPAQHKAYYFTMDNSTYGSLISPCELSAANGESIAFVAENLPATQAPVVLTVPYGSGKITAIGFDIGSQYLDGEQYLHRDLMSRICNALYTPTVKLEAACGRLELMTLQKDQKLMVQLVNAGGSHANAATATDDLIPPVLDISLSLALEKEPQAIILQPEHRPLDVVYRDGRYHVQIPRVDIHSILEIIPG